MGGDVFGARQMRLFMPKTFFLCIGFCMTNSWLAQPLSVACRLRILLGTAVNTTRLQVYIFVHFLI